MDIDFVELGSLIETDCQGLVIPANVELWISSHMGQDLIVYGGESIEMEAMTQGPCALGDVIATSAGQLKTLSLILHAVVYGGTYWFPEPSHIEQATFKSFVMANEYPVESLALTMLGEVHRTCTLEEIALAMWNGLHRFLKENPTPNIQTLKFVIDNEDLLDQFYEAFALAQENASQSA